MRGALLLVPLAFGLMAPASAETNGVQVTPVIVRIEPDRRSTSLRLRNWRESEVAFEVRAYEWRQVNGEDVLSEITDIVVAPPVFAVQPGAEQIVRLAMVADQRGAGREAAYRIVLRQLPVAETDAGLRVQLQMSLPVFAPPRSGLPNLVARRDASGAVVVSNNGTSVARLVAVDYEGGEALDDTPRYLLAGAEFARPLPAQVDAVRVTYTSFASPSPLTEIVPIHAPLAVGDRS